VQRVTTAQVYLGLKQADLKTHRLGFHFILASLMALFYLLRWISGEHPASVRGLLLPAEDFYLYSSLTAFVVWPLNVEVTAQIGALWTEDSKYSHATHSSLPRHLFYG